MAKSDPETSALKEQLSEALAQVDSLQAAVADAEARAARDFICLAVGPCQEALFLEYLVVYPQSHNDGKNRKDDCAVYQESSQEIEIKKDEDGGP